MLKINSNPKKEKIAFQRPLATYSIVAYDPETGECGVAVQSHWFSVGSVVPWAKSEIGAVATQSFVDPSYGPLGLTLMQAGKLPHEALDALLTADPSRETRQVAMIDTNGNVAVHTGSRCIAEAGHIQGENFSVQANMMGSNRVWPAMEEAFVTADGDLADRLLTALEAAEDVGGDVRGKQSAALLVVRGCSTGRSWRDTKFDLRVEDHVTPLEELRRLLRISRAYKHASRGDELVANQKLPEAKRAYEAAASLAPEKSELTFWHAVALVSSDKYNEARPLFAKLFEEEPQWRELVRRLPDAGILPENRELIESIISIDS